MKLAALFAKYLYEHKELRLPGIGVFTLDPSVPVPDGTEKNTIDFTNHIRFSQQPVPHADEAFINFIRTQTGKIKPLAESDLDSFLSDGKILLNIGKPFHFEGIGYLQKTREGRYEFMPGEPSLQRHPPLHQAAIEVKEEPSRKKSFYSDEVTSPNRARNILLVAAGAVGLMLVIWLGYSFYNRNSGSAPLASADSVTVSPSETTNANTILDSAQRKIDSARNAALQAGTASTGSYKFIIERTANKVRAYRRFNQIKAAEANIKLESPDSTYFTLYLILPAQPADTARMSDSLEVWYARKRVLVEPVR